MEEERTYKYTCDICRNVGFRKPDDGFYYCLLCNSQAQDIVEADVADEDFVDTGAPGGGAIYSAVHTRRRPTAIKAEPIPQIPSQTQTQTHSQLWSLLDDTPAKETPAKEDDENRGVEFEDGIGPTEPADFGDGVVTELNEDYHREVRMKYVFGLQLMIQFQCEALVKHFNVNPMICGLSGTIWLRFLAKTRVFDDKWAEDMFQESESQKQGDRRDTKTRAKYRAEPHNFYGQRLVMIWYRSLRNTIPLSYSLAISYLACHIVREAVLPSDIIKWSVEGELPYFAAFLDIEKQIGPPSRACPLGSSFMFKPSQIIPVQKLESLAAYIAEFIGLHLPPVNFHGIASRYLQQLSLPIQKILSHACKIYEWSMPPDLWLSVNDLRLPTRVGVMSILIVAIRILYNIHGFGAWEKSFLSRSSSSSKAVSNDDDEAERGSGPPSPSTDHGYGNTSQFQKSDLDASELLRNLDGIYKDIGETYDFSKDLPKYLQYCNNVAFAGLEPSFENSGEERIATQLWDFYQKEKDFVPTEIHKGESCADLSRKRLREGAMKISEDNKKIRDDGLVPDDRKSHSHDSQQQSMEDVHASQSPQGDQCLESSSEDAMETERDEAIRRLKLDMEEKRFYYVPPRVCLKRFDYLHYARKKDEGALTYIAHADYYILLRACAKVVQIDIRTLHFGVLSFERRLGWLEKRIDHCLHLKPPDETCEHCSYVPCPPPDVVVDDDDPIGLSDLSL